MKSRLNSTNLHASYISICQQKIVLATIHHLLNGEIIVRHNAQTLLCIVIKLQANFKSGHSPDWANLSI